MVVAALATLVALGLAGARVMEERGHVVTGMTQQVVWGMPHVFAIFLIVAASGALNVASIASAFREPAYKPHAPLSVLLALALLSGGLMVLVLDLGRPERLVVAATRYNFRSIFAWNMFLYTGFMAIGAAYLWTMLEKRFGRWSHSVGVLAFTWRIVLTTGTGSIFGFLVARQAYAAAVIAPLFIALSLAWGTAAYCVAQPALALAGGAPMGEEMERRLARLLGLFLVVVLWLAAVYHLTNLYWAKQSAFERFLLVRGAPYPEIFWIGFVVLGCVVPIALLWQPRLAGPRALVAAAVLVLLGAVAFLYVFVIGGQAFPLEIFPGYAASSSFGDGVAARYVPSAPEIALGVAGVAFAALVTAIGARLFAIVPGLHAVRP
ncbi:MAG TPA: NrfD/PsrC family molybdoenzyme membrane anchor subunit [Usitatibacter sp.]|nr:NrfD/PsrC family molybdoenzyme membrane anchor subunit [Usitatibacter sp.]